MVRGVVNGSRYKGSFPARERTDVRKRVRQGKQVLRKGNERVLVDEKSRPK